MSDLPPQGSTPDTPAMPPTVNDMLREQPLTSAFVRDLWEKGQKDLMPAIRTFENIRAFVSGQQFVQWNPGMVRMESQDLISERTMVAANRMRPSLRRQAAKLLQRPLAFIVPPDDSDDATVAAAKLAERVIASTAREHNWEELRHDLVWGCPQSGTMILAVDWDPAAGTPMPEDASGQPVGTGDTCEYLLQLTEVAFEPGTRNAEHSRYWIRGSVLPPDEIRERYRLNWRPSSDANERSSPMARAVAMESEQVVKPDLTLVLTYYERPSWLRPKGAVCVVVNDKIVSQSEWTFPFTDQLNCDVVRFQPSERRWYGETVWADAIGPQRVLNHAVSALAEHAKKVGSAKLIFQAGDETLADEWDDDPGSTAVTKAQAPPVWVSPPQLPNWLITLPEKMEREIDDIIGDFNVARGQSSGSITSGSGLALLAEQGDRPLSMFASAMEAGFSGMATKVLKIFEQKVEDPRQAKVRTTPKSAPDVRDWVGDDLMGQVNAEVPADQLAPVSKLSLWQAAVDLWDKKIITDPRAFAQAAEYSKADSLFDNIDVHVAKAKRENYVMSLGQVCVPEDFDNHATHIEWHTRFQVSEQWDELDPQIQKDMILHKQGHATLAAQAAGMQVARANTHPALAGAASASQDPQLAALMAGTPGATPPMGGTAPTSDGPVNEQGAPIGAQYPMPTHDQPAGAAPQ